MPVPAYSAISIHFESHQHLTTTKGRHRPHSRVQLRRRSGRLDHTRGDRRRLLSGPRFRLLEAVSPRSHRRVRDIICLDDHENLQLNQIRARDRRVGIVEVGTWSINGPRLYQWTIRYGADGWDMNEL